MNKPTAVLISDIHYNLTNLKLADEALRQAIDYAADLDVDLIIAGDLHDTKAIMRGECVSVMLETFKYALNRGVEPTLLVGNHDLFNEKGIGHSLEFLSGYANIVADGPIQIKGGIWLLPYQSDPTNFENKIKSVPDGAMIIMHQGVTGAASGEYLYDKSAISKELLANFRTISGHYHKSQDIECGVVRQGNVGLMSYIGSPYTISYAEANDGPKGFQVLYSDGTLQQVTTNLRKHVILEMCSHELQYDFGLKDIVPEDIVWVKLKGPSLELENIKKSDLSRALELPHSNFRLDKIPTDSNQIGKEIKSNEALLDEIIDASGETEETKKQLKALWRSLT